MAGAAEHRHFRDVALNLAKTQIILDFGTIVQPDLLALERIKPSDWQIVHPAWREHPARRHLKIDFNWLKQRNKRRDKLDVSIWYQGTLCGLFLAKLSRRRISVALRFLESNPFPHGLAGLMIPIGLTIAENFGLVYGAPQVMISHPERNLVQMYRGQGYELIAADLDREKRGCQVRAKLMIKMLS